MVCMYSLIPYYCATYWKNLEKPVLEVLELDIEYPKELHKSQRDLPFLFDRKLLEKTNS